MGGGKAAAPKLQKKRVTKAGSWLIIFNHYTSIKFFILVSGTPLIKKIMTDYFGFFVKLTVISVIIAIATIIFVPFKKYKIAKIVLLIIAGILFIIGAGGCFLMTISNVGSYRY
ncbi:hypothetical protein C1637_03090 [Chryseobacterium lactis]|uniref:Uncharacterized protein n=2 Tax=Chryseobacterium lactis TaxID=1241981 RepID=A0A3G6RTF3_CHRLC|nr:hypothetical protein EG342_06485 [Chryseobacterium lactis]AZB06569.1 hypothetical protein EG341_22605 [Chryseobacterium lactis]PNW15420.1 hypothetical protein C1637_03090 [Chryseobacterium lactis]